MLPSEEPDASEYHSVLTSIGEDGLWNEKGRIAANIERLTEASREGRIAVYTYYALEETNYKRRRQISESIKRRGLANFNVSRDDKPIRSEKVKIFSWHFVN